MPRKQLPPRQKGRDTPYRSRPSLETMHLAPSGRQNRRQTQKWSEAVWPQAKKNTATDDTVEASTPRTRMNAGYAGSFLHRCLKRTRCNGAIGPPWLRLFSPEHQPRRLLCRSLKPPGGYSLMNADDRGLAVGPTKRSPSCLAFPEINRVRAYPPPETGPPAGWQRRDIRCGRWSQAPLGPDGKTASTRSTNRVLLFCLCLELPSRILLHWLCGMGKQCSISVRTE